MSTATPLLLPALREDFPSLRAHPQVVYLDSAATTLKPQCVIDEVAWALGEGAAPVYRGVYSRSVEATERFDDARATIARWFSVAEDQVVLTRGATDGLNLVRRGLRGFRSVITSVAEHHSNLLPWRDGTDFRTLGVDREGRVSVEQLEESLQSRRADLVVVSHAGNVLGTVQAVREFCEVARRYGALSLVDAAQTASHLPVGPAELGADFIVCSAHKMLGPSGVGALVGRLDALERLDPVSLGGGMAQSVDSESYQPQAGPRRLEAGTPSFEALLGWEAAINYLALLDRERVHRHLEAVTQLALDRLGGIDGVHLLGPQSAADRTGLVAIKIEAWEAHAAACALSRRDGIYLRSGFHCAEPLHHYLGMVPTLRASFHVYTTPADIDRLVAGVRRLACLRVG